MMPVARLENVSKRYRDQVALANVSLEVPAGGVFALLGENGAGKTTAIKVLLGLERADAGRAELLNAASVPEKLTVRARVGYVTDQPPLYPWMTVERIGWFTAAFYDAEFMPRYEQLIARFELPARRKIKQLSRGMQAEVALALALAADPELLILDEATAGLDPMVRRDFLESMVDRASAGKTVLLASHHIAEVERVADYVAILHAGRLLVCDRLERLKTTYHSVTLSVEHPQQQPPPWQCGEIIAGMGSGRQWSLLVKADPHALAAESHQRDDLLDVNVRMATLEEIYLGLLRPTIVQRRRDAVSKEVQA